MAGSCGTIPSPSHTRSPRARGVCSCSPGAVGSCRRGRAHPAGLAVGSAELRRAQRGSRCPRLEAAPLLGRGQRPPPQEDRPPTPPGWAAPGAGLRAPSAPARRRGGAGRARPYKGGGGGGRPLLTGTGGRARRRPRSRDKARP